MVKSNINWSIGTDLKTKLFTFRAEVNKNDILGKKLLLSFVSICNIFKK